MKRLLVTEGERESSYENRSNIIFSLSQADSVFLCFEKFISELLPQNNIIFQYFEHHKLKSIHLHCIGLVTYIPQTNISKPNH